MDAVEYLRERNRMCESYAPDCNNCELLKEKICATHRTKEQAEKAIKIVEQWSKEHPKKTRAIEFLKEYPNARMNAVDRFPNVDPCMLDWGLYKASRCCELGCTNCRERYWTEEIE